MIPWIFVALSSVMHFELGIDTYIYGFREGNPRKNTSLTPEDPLRSPTPKTIGRLHAFPQASIGEQDATWHQGIAWRAITWVSINVLFPPASQVFHCQVLSHCHHLHHVWHVSQVTIHDELRTATWEQAFHRQLAHPDLQVHSPMQKLLWAHCHIPSLIASYQDGTAPSDILGSHRISMQLKWGLIVQSPENMWGSAVHKRSTNVASSVSTKHAAADDLTGETPLFFYPCGRFFNLTH